MEKKIQIKTIDSKFKENNSKSFRTFIFNYDGQIIREEDGLFYKINEYNSDKKLIYSETQDFTEKYEYNGLFIKYTNSKNLEWIKEIDVRANEIFYKEKKNFSWYFKFLKNGQIDENTYGLKWKKDYDKNNNEIYYEDNLKLKEWKKYDDKNNLISKIDNRGFNLSFLYEYDEYENIISFKNSFGHHWHKKYDTNNNLIYFKARQGIEEYYDYLDNLLVKKHTVNDGLTIFYQYDKKRRLIRETHSNGYSNNILYNSDNTIILEEDNSNVKRISKYDEFGNIIYFENQFVIEEYYYEYF